jgi:hypothetical protein
MGPAGVADAKCAFGGNLIIPVLQSHFRNTAVSVWPAEVKVAKWLKGTKDALARNALGPGEASKLAGRLSWANVHALGKLGRAMLLPVRQQ